MNFERPPGLYCLPCVVNFSHRSDVHLRNEFRLR